MCGKCSVYKDLLKKITIFPTGLVFLNWGENGDKYVEFQISGNCATNFSCAM